MGNMHGFLTEQLFFVYAVPDQSPDRVYHRLLILLIGHTEPFIRCIQYADFRLPLLYQIVNNLREQVFCLNILRL